GGIQYGPTEAEQGSMRFRRSLYIAQDIQAGEVLTRENLRCIRPGFGLAPKHYDSLLGRRVNRDLLMGTAMAWEYFG
ncbi:SAF domain-containing protein, partial [Lamprobacter modestohalophilus]|uniref:SAF domain-containing protein n=1 Tax=Lamprobacter modestohalophilus TaxID=1064514 RepID=UPI002ADED9F3